MTTRVPGIDAIVEVEDILREVPEGHRGVGFQRTLSSFSPDDVSLKFERALAVLWAEWNTPEVQGNILVTLLCRDDPRGFNQVTERDQVVAATVVQWLGTRIGEAFLREAFLQAGGECVIKYPLQPEK